jgi:hypothetical protein
MPRDTASAFAGRTISGSSFEKKNEKPNSTGNGKRPTGNMSRTCGEIKITIGVDEFRIQVTGRDDGGRSSFHPVNLPNQAVTYSGFQEKHRFAVPPAPTLPDTIFGCQ